MTNWMSDISDLLQKRIDADVVAGDVPREYDSLKEEFKQNEEMLAELEGYAAELESQGNMEASARLHEQIQLLKNHYDEVSVKFRKFQRPADFEPKFSRVKRELDSIGEQIHLVEIGSEDPASLQDKLDIAVVSCPNAWPTKSSRKKQGIDFKQCVFVSLFRIFL
jgi:dystrophin